MNLLRQCLPPLLIAFSVLAAAEPEEAVTARADRARAQALRQQADNDRKAAEERFKTEQNACYAKILVNDCLEQAKKVRHAAIIAARKPEVEAREIERLWRQQEAEEREARRRIDGPRREREAEERAARNRAEREEAEQRVARRQTEKARATGDAARPE